MYRKLIKDKDWSCNITEEQFCLSIILNAIFNPKLYSAIDRHWREFFLLWFQDKCDYNVFHTFWYYYDYNVTFTITVNHFITFSYFSIVIIFIYILKKCLLLLPILYITASVEGKALAVVSQVLTEPRGLQHHCKNCLKDLNVVVWLERKGILNFLANFKDFCLHFSDVVDFWDISPIIFLLFIMQKLCLINIKGITFIQLCSVIC